MRPSFRYFIGKGVYSCGLLSGDPDSKRLFPLCKRVSGTDRCFVEQESDAFSPLEASTGACRSCGRW
jgi:hypothetical protein